MANTYTNPFIHNIGLNEENSLSHLLDHISPEIEHETTLIEHSKYYNDVEFKNVLQNTNSKISMLSLNCQSINAKFDKLKLFLAHVNIECPISVICIQESWAHENVDMSQFLLPNYSLIFENRRLSTHGGLIMYVHDDFAYKDLNQEIIISGTSTLFESHFVEIWRKTCRFQKYVIGNVYRLPSYNAEDLSAFTNEYSDLLNRLRTRPKFVYICGDYNIDILIMCSNNNYNTIYENVISSSFAPKITLPTRICDTTSTLIDNIYTNVLDKSHTSGILIRPISDHQMYFCIMNENYMKPAIAQKYVEVEVFNVDAIENFKTEIANLEIYDKLDKTLNRDPNHNYEIFSTLLQNAKSKHIPKRIKKFNKRRHKKERWMTDELLAQVIKKNEMYVDWKTTPIAHPDYEKVKFNFKGYEKIILKGIERAKRDYFDRVFLAYKCDMKRTWQVISETLNRNKREHDMPSLFTHEGRDLVDSTEIANAFNTYFANIGKNLSSQIDQNNVIADYKQYLTSPTRETLKFECITKDYTIKAIDNLENKNSSGHDGISNTLLKTIKNDISQSLTIIINQMLTTGIFPDAFKLSKVIPLFKKGDSSLLVNYRPISLLPTISKVFERVIHDQMYEYFNQFNLLAEQQYGFRKQHSTEYAAIKLIDHVSKEIEAGKTPTSVYIELSKAFDTLTFEVLLYNLKYYGVTDTVFDLLKSYLTNRKQYVVFDGCQSEHVEIYTGVPQGSILGPLFFSIYINDLITVSDRLNFLMYADDTTIYFNLEDFDNLTKETDINRELEKVNIWLKLNKLSLNTQKTKLMLFHRKQKHLDEINVVINGIEIEHVPSFNFLGIMLDENLSWKSHIKMVGNKISKVTGILYRLKNVFPENVLFVLYNSLIVSYMNYGLLLWGIHSHKLELLQKKALRLMTNSNYLAHTTPLLIKHGLLNVRDMYKLKLLKFYYKLSYDLLPPYFNKYIEIIEQKPARDLRFQYIHAPLVKRVYAECSPLFQLIKLINSLRNDPNDTIFKKIVEKSHSYNGFAFNVTRTFLDNYDPICRTEMCYVCKL